MRLITKAAIVLFVLYLAFVAGIGVWMERSVRSLSRRMLKNTARLVGNDIAAVISKVAIDELLRNDPTARERLEQTIEDITARSEVVSSVSVVDASGKVVASDEMEVGRPVADPDLIFPSEGHPEFGSPRLILQGDAYFLFVPLLDRQSIVGYLRLALNSEPFAVVYSRARRDFTVLAASGLIGMIVLLALLQSALQRHTTRLIEILDQSRINHRRDEGHGSEEFALVHGAAHRVGAQLVAAQQHALHSKQHFDALLEITASAVLILGADKALEFANYRARVLLGYPEDGALENHWNEVQALLEDTWDSSSSDSSGTRLEIELPDHKPPRSLRLQTVDLDGAGASGYAVLVSDQGLDAAAYDDRRFALQMRALQAMCVGSPATLRTVAASIDTNLQSLRSALEEFHEPRGDDLRERATEYVDSIEDEAETLDKLCAALLSSIGPSSTAHSAFDLRDLFADILPLVASLSKRRHIEIAPFDTDEPLVLAAAYRGVGDVILNLLLHIMDWLPEGAKVASDVSLISSRLAITIQSSLASRLAAESPSLFDQYIPDEHGVARLGLHLAREALDRLDGRLEVYSAPSGGTSYRISVPLATRPSPNVARVVTDEKVKGNLPDSRRAEF